MKSARRALDEARQACSDDAKRNVLVAKAEADARQQKAVSFAIEHSADLLDALYRQGSEVVTETNAHLAAAAELKTAYQAVYASGAAILRLIVRNTGDLPSADRALACYRDISKLASESLPVPAVRPRYEAFTA